MSGTPCAKCGREVATGEGRVLVQFSVDELVELAVATTSPAVRARLLCAASLLADPDEIDALVAAMTEA